MLIVPRAYLADSDGIEFIIFLVFVLISIIASLVKKASETAKRSTLAGPGARPQPGGPARPSPRAPTFSEFIRRIQGAAEPERPVAPLEREVRQTRPRTVLPTPPLPRRPTAQQKPAIRPVSIRQPRLRPVEAQAQRPAPEALAGAKLYVEEPLEVKVSLSELVSQPTTEPPRAEPRAAALARPGMAVLESGVHAEGGLSTSELRRGIILAEILGPPRALRPRRMGRRPGAPRPK